MFPSSTNISNFLDNDQTLEQNKNYEEEASIGPHKGKFFSLYDLASEISPVKKNVGSDQLINLEDSFMSSLKTLNQKGNTQQQEVTSFTSAASTTYDSSNLSSLNLSNLNQSNILFLNQSQNLCKDQMNSLNNTEGLETVEYQTRTSDQQLSKQLILMEMPKPAPQIQNFDSNLSFTKINCSLNDELEIQRWMKQLSSLEVAAIWKFPELNTILKAPYRQKEELYISLNSPQINIKKANYSLYTQAEWLIITRYLKGWDDLSNQTKKNLIQVIHTRTPDLLTYDNLNAQQCNEILTTEGRWDLKTLNCVLNTPLKLLMEVSTQRDNHILEAINSTNQKLSEIMNNYNYLISLINNFSNEKNTNNKSAQESPSKLKNIIEERENYLRSQIAEVINSIQTQFTTINQHRESDVKQIFEINEAIKELKTQASNQSNYQAQINELKNFILYANQKQEPTVTQNQIVNLIDKNQMQNEINELKNIIKQQETEQIKKDLNEVKMNLKTLETNFNKDTINDLKQHIEENYLKQINFKNYLNKFINNSTLVNIEKLHNLNWFETKINNLQSIKTKQTYNKQEINSMLKDKVSISTLNQTINTYLNENQIINLINQKLINYNTREENNINLKNELSNTYTKQQINNLLTEYYSKTQIDNIINENSYEKQIKSIKTQIISMEEQIKNSQNTTNAQQISNKQYDELITKLNNKQDRSNAYVTHTQYNSIISLIEKKLDKETFNQQIVKNAQNLETFRTQLNANLTDAFTKQILSINETKERITKLENKQIDLNHYVKNTEFNSKIEEIKNDIKEKNSNLRNELNSKGNLDEITKLIQNKIDKQDIINYNHTIDNLKNLIEANKNSSNNLNQLYADLKTKIELKQDKIQFIITQQQYDEINQKIEQQLQTTITYETKLTELTSIIEELNKANVSFVTSYKEISLNTEKLTLNYNEVREELDKNTQTMQTKLKQYYTKDEINSKFYAKYEVNSELSKKADINETYNKAQIKNQMEAIIDNKFKLFNQTTNKTSDKQIIKLIEEKIKQIHTEEISSQQIINTIKTYNNENKDHNNDNIRKCITAYMAISLPCRIRELFDWEEPKNNFANSMLKRITDKVNEELKTKTEINTISLTAENEINKNQDNNGEQIIHQAIRISTNNNQNQNSNSRTSIPNNIQPENQNECCQWCTEQIDNINHKLNDYKNIIDRNTRNIQTNVTNLTQTQQQLNEMNKLIEEQINPMISNLIDFTGMEDENDPYVDDNRESDIDELDLQERSMQSINDAPILDEAIHKKTALSPDERGNSARDMSRIKNQMFIGNQPIAIKIKKILNIMSDHQTQIDQLFDKDKEVNGNLIMNVNKMEADVKTIMEKFKPANQTNLDSKLEKVKESLNKRIDILNQTFNSFLNPLQDQFIKKIQESNLSPDAEKTIITNKLQNLQVTEKIALLLELYVSNKKTTDHKIGKIQDRLNIDNRDITNLMKENAQDPRNSIDNDAKQYIDNLTMATANQAKLFACKKKETNKLINSLKVNRKLCLFLKDTNLQPNSITGLKIAIKQQQNSQELLEELKTRFDFYYKDIPSIKRDKTNKHKPTKEAYEAYYNTIQEEKDTFLAKLSNKNNISTKLIHKWKLMWDKRIKYQQTFPNTSNNQEDLIDTSSQNTNSIIQNNANPTPNPSPDKKHQISNEMRIDYQM